MGSSVRYDELAAAEDVADESSQQSLGEFVSDTSEPKRLGEFLGGRLAGSDVDPVEEIRRLRRRERE